MCSTKALLAGDADVLSDIYRERVTNRAARGTPGSPPWGWDTAYGSRPRRAQPGGTMQPAPPPAHRSEIVRRVASCKQGASAAALAVGVRAALLLAGCGERPQVIKYKQGTYQGKPDKPAWDSAKFNGDRTDVRARDQAAQPEPERIQAHASWRDAAEDDRERMSMRHRMQRWVRASLP